MNTQKIAITLGLMLASVFTLPAARASELDQATKLTFNQSVQIPGRVLQAGTYWFIVDDSPSGSNIVRIFNSDRSTLFATVLTVDAERLATTDRTALTFAERDSMQPNAILTWYYPARNFGHEFVYSGSEWRELARAKHETLVAAAPGKFQGAVTGD